MPEELENYSIHDLVQEIKSRPDFFGVLIYANRNLGDIASAPDDKLFVAFNPEMGHALAIRTLARAIDICTGEL